MSTKVHFHALTVMLILFGTLAAFGVVQLIVVALGWSAGSAVMPLGVTVIGAWGTVCAIGVRRAFSHDAEATHRDVFRAIGFTALEGAYFTSFCGAFTTLLSGLVFAGAGVDSGVAWLIASGILTVVTLLLHLVVSRRWRREVIDGFAFMPDEEEERA